MTADCQIDWLDFGRAPKCAPNPKYPNGVDMDASDGAALTCSVQLAHPAPGCGAYVVRCRACGNTVSVTTAGRPDDPRSLKMACRRRADD
jgi:hypothetical protein